MDPLKAGSGVDGLSILQDPCVRFVQCQLDQWDVVAGESCGFVPNTALAEQSNDGHGVAEVGASLFPPDADSDQASSKFVYW